MLKFEVGQTYATRFACDYDTLLTVVVTRRTAKTVWFTYLGKTEMRRIYRDYNGNEAFNPTGSYSMAPVISADDIHATH